MLQCVIRGVDQLESLLSSRAFAMFSPLLAVWMEMPDEPPPRPVELAFREGGAEAEYFSWAQTIEAWKHIIVRGGGYLSTIIKRLR